MDDGNGVEVHDPPTQGEERESLLGYLQRQRDLVAWKLQDASEASLRSASTPTGLTAHGIVRHLTNVERGWLRDTFAAEEGLTFDYSDDDPDGDFRVPDAVTIDDVLREYAAESRRCDAAIDAASPDDTAAARDLSLRWILLHLIEETARHLGHLDLLREQADGRVGEDPG
jgi:uncharacterized damage-inducible protein DinB